jgi:hypothetical protein
MSTFGVLRFRLQRAYPTVDRELIAGFVNDAREDILNIVPWRQFLTIRTYSLAGEYNAGTVSAVQGSNLITGVGTSWDPAFAGRRLRLAGESEWYGFTPTTPTAATLDRIYTQADRSDVGYSLSDPLILLPADLDVILSLTLMAPERALVEDAGQVFQLDPGRTFALGSPTFYRQYQDDGVAGSPSAQLELVPAPAAPTSLVLEYISRPAELTSSGQQVGSGLSGLIYLAAEVQVANSIPDHGRADRAQALFDRRLQNVLGRDAVKSPNTRIRMSGAYSFRAHKI